MRRKERLDIKSAKALIGRPVNLHLKDGSVILYIIPVQAGGEKPEILWYEVPTKTTKRRNQVLLKNVGWVQLLNRLLLL